MLIRLPYSLETPSSSAVRKPASSFLFQCRRRLAAWVLHKQTFLKDKENRGTQWYVRKSKASLGVQNMIDSFPHFQAVIRACRAPKRALSEDDFWALRVRSDIARHSILDAESKQSISDSFSQYRTSTTILYASASSTMSALPAVHAQTHYTFC